MDNMKLFLEKSEVLQNSTNSEVREKGVEMLKESYKWIGNRVKEYSVTLKKS